MSNLNSDEPISKPSSNIGETTSSRSMLVTILLLIAGFAMTGTMMIHYTQTNSPALAEESEIPQSNGHAGQNAFDLTSWITTFKDHVESEKAPNPNETISIEAQPNGNPEKTETGGISKLFVGERVRWPKLKLTGFGTSRDGLGGFAIINGEQVHPGQLIDEKVEVVEIRAQDVVVRYMGETKTLTVDVND